MERKVLLISHNALGKENNMARTLEHQFSGLKSNQISQLYFSDEKPNSEYCNNFFRISDSEVFRSIFSRKQAGDKVQSLTKKVGESKDLWIKTNIRKKGNRKPSIYLIRNLIWKLGKWKTKKLDAWVDNFNPDVIYFASGDYSFSYVVALYIAQKRNIPLIVGCYDDFYIDTKKTIDPIYNYTYHDLMQKVRKTFKYASTFVAVSDLMKDDYSKLFNKQGHTLYTPTSLLNIKENPAKNKSIIYAGNLGHGRAEQLVSMGKILKKIGNSEINHIDVYSGEIRPEITENLTIENGINFRGKVTPEQVQTLLLNSKYVIHTESFEDTLKKRVKYSLSTKIADYLASGACIIAYGPKEVASILYLKEEEAACVVLDEESLERKLKELFTSSNINKTYCESAKKLAIKNHSDYKIRNTLNEIINSVSIS